MSLRRDLATRLAQQHPDEAAAALEALAADEAGEFLATLSAKDAAGVLQRVTAHPAAEMLARLDSERAAELVGHLAVNVASSYLGRLDPASREAILDRVAPARAASLRVLLRHREDTAGALMDPEVLALPHDIDIREAVQRVRDSAENARYNIYVVDRDDKLVAVLNLRELLLANPDRPIAQIMHPDPIHLTADTDWRSVIDHPGWRVAHSLPVVDESGTYLGAIRYRTLRMLEARRNAVRPHGAVTSQALGDLFWTGVSGMLDAVSMGGAVTTPERGGARDGDD